MNQTDSVTLHGERVALAAALILIAIMAAIGMETRPMTPIDETRYISVAWEMWLRGDYLVPFKNGEPYSHKPPLLMWFYQLGWAVFGVNEWWPRLVSPLFSAAGLILTRYLARRLWPERTGLGGRAALVLASCLLWIFFSTAAMFDVMLACFTLIGMHGILTAANGRMRLGFGLLGVAIGFGVLAKGPVILLHTLPVAVLAPWWRPGLRWGRWAAGIGAAVLCGAAIALAWAVPAGFAGGDEYRRAIFWGQTADRMVQSFAHKRPLWWYLPLLPVMFFPWLLWSGVWLGLKRLSAGGLDGGARFCVAWMLPVFIAFSLISGKQMHYLIPIFPAFALLAARALGNEVRGGTWLPAIVAALVGISLSVLALDRLPLAKNPLPELPVLWPSLLLTVLALALVVLGLCCRRHTLPLLALCGALLAGLAQFAISRAFFSDYDTRPLAEAIAVVQAGGKQVANDGFYHDQFHFAGRLRQPLVAFDDEPDLVAWLKRNPEACAVVYLKNEKRLQGRKTIAVHGYMGGVAALLTADEAIAVLTGN